MGNGESSEATQLALAEAALEKNEWTRARELMHQLACAVPMNKHYRAQLGYARAGELMAAGQHTRAREELERVIRIAPDHALALAMLGRARRPSSRLLALFRR
ncbi:MAG: tetratricopeptide repeat protein [Kofleriaceae bacterium]